MRGSAAFRSAIAPGGVLAGPWVQNELWRRARAKPSLDLRLAERKSLVDATSGQNLVTFTRASSGTYVDSQGVIRTATTNLLLRSEEFGTTWTATRANISSDAAVAPNGSVTADKLVEDTTATSTHVVTQAGINYVSGLSYTFSCYVKEAGRQSVRLSFPAAAFTTNIFGHFNLANGSVVSSSTGVVSTITDVGNGWYRCSATATATASASAGVTVFVGETSNSTTTSFSGDGTSGLFLWGAQLEQSSSVGEYIPTGATINSAPRFDHNPTTGESLGLLVEEQRTNLALQSEDFSTTWSRVNILAFGSGSVLNDATAPNGAQTADKIVANSANGQHRLDQTPTSSAGAQTFSVYAKPAGYNYIGLRIGTVGANFDLTAGSVINLVTSTSAAITRMPNGWYRCSVYVASASANDVIRINISNNTSFSPSFVGDGTSGLYLWGAQLEAGAFPTSYIPTTTATATRSADVATDTTRGAALRSLFAQFCSPASGTRPIVSLDDNTANERIELFTSGTDPKLLVTDGGSAQADIDAGAITANTTARLAARFGTDNFAASVSGGAEVLDATGTMPTVDRIRIGRDQAGNYLNGTIARITGWDAPLNVLPQLTQ